MITLNASRKVDDVSLLKKEAPTSDAPNIIRQAPPKEKKETKLNSCLKQFHTISHAALSGIIGAQSVLFGNISVQLLNIAMRGSLICPISTNYTTLYDHYKTELQSWSTLETAIVFIVATVALTAIWMQIFFLNIALKRYDAMLVVPVYQSLWIIVAVIGGGVFFEDFKSFETYQWICFPIGVIICIAGVFLLAENRKKVNSTRVEPKPDRGTVASVEETPGTKSVTIERHRAIDAEMTQKEKVGREIDDNIVLMDL